MVRVSVFTKNDLFRYLAKLGAMIAVLYIIIKIYEYSKSNFSGNKMTTEQCISYIAEEITAIGKNESDNLLELNSENIIGSELRMSMAVSSRASDSIPENLKDEQGDSQSNSQTSAEAKSNETQNEQLDNVSTDVKTEVVQTKYKDNYNVQIEGVKIKNETSYDLNNLGITSNIDVKNRNVIIYHTHTCESYTPTSKNSYSSSGNYRTTDLKYTVAKVGDELDKYLTNYGFNVTHNKTYHDYPAYTGSYGRSLTTVSNLLAKSSNTDILIDLHRDAIGDESYAPKVKIGDEYAAQIMFVIGTDGSGLEHPNWKHNLEYAIKLQKKANEMYPGLFKAILVTNARYNQHLSSDCTIMEFGATGNTLEECEVSAKYLAKVMDELVK